MKLFKKKAVNQKFKQSEIYNDVPLSKNKSSFKDVSHVTQRISVIGNTFSIKGEIHADEEILINGIVRGKVFSKNKVVIGNKGKINADIEANEILIYGRVIGNVKGLSKVEVFSQGYLKGNILSKSVIIAEGANFKGNIDMNIKED